MKNSEKRSQLGLVASPIPPFLLPFLILENGIYIQEIGMVPREGIEFQRKRLIAIPFTLIQNPKKHREGKTRNLSTLFLNLKQREKILTFVDYLQGSFPSKNSSSNSTLDTTTRTSPLFFDKEQVMWEPLFEGKNVLQKNDFFFVQLRERVCDKRD